MVQLSRKFHFESIIHVVVLQPQCRRNGIGLGSSPFDRHYLGNHCCFLFLRILRCFSSPGSPPDKSGYRDFIAVGCPIGKSADQTVFAGPRSISQLITSFIASESLGILHTPFSTFFNFENYCFKSLVALFLNLSHHVKELFGRQRPINKKSHIVSWLTSAYVAVALIRRDLKAIINS